MKIPAVLAAIVGLAASQGSTIDPRTVNILPSYSNNAQLSALYDPLSSFMNALFSDLPGMVVGEVPTSITDGSQLSGLIASLETQFPSITDPAGNFYYYYFLT